MGWNPIEDVKGAVSDIGGIVSDPGSIIRGSGGSGGGGAAIAGHMRGVLDRSMRAKEAADAEAERKRVQRQELYDESSAFRSNLPSYTADRVRGLIPTYNEALSEGERRTRESFGRRGLSGSGLARAADTKFRGSIASKLAQSKVGIQMEGEQLARQKEGAAASLGLSEAQRLMANAEQLYNLNAANDIARRKSLGQLATGIGYGVGSYYGANSVKDSSLDQNTQARRGLLTDYTSGINYNDYNPEELPA